MIMKMEFDYDLENHAFGIVWPHTQMHTSTMVPKKISTDQTTKTKIDSRHM